MTRRITKDLASSGGYVTDMRKRELIHLHTLLSRARRFVSRREDVPDSAFEPYDDLDVAPTAVYEAKGDHQAAVRALAAALASIAEEAQRDDVEGDAESSSDPGIEEPLGATTD